MLEIGCAGGERSDRRRVAGPTRRGEQRHDEETAPHLERDVVDVGVRHAVAEEVQRQSEQGRARPGADRGPDCRARCRMERHDHPVFVPDALKLVRPAADLTLRGS